MMRWKKITLLLCILTLMISPLVLGSTGEEYSVPFNESALYFNQLLLDIYVDETGKALVTGYVDDLQGLPFLQTAEYLYENDTQQLYALTNALTWKSGDLWTLNLTCPAYYTDYHVVFYLPAEVSLGRITCSDDLNYLVSALNDSFVVDIEGYEVESPLIMIEYQQPLTESAGGEESEHGYQPGFVLLLIALSGVTAALIISLARRRREEDGRQLEEPTAEREGIEITPEMARIMETLTDRERAIVTALLKHNGEMTQADLRYETEIPKSSLTGILRTLERRQIVKKKEWGRTNVIELSEWFLSQTERNGGV